MRNKFEKVDEKLQNFFSRAKTYNYCVCSLFFVFFFFIVSQTRVPIKCTKYSKISVAFVQSFRFVKRTIFHDVRLLYYLNWFLFILAYDSTENRKRYEYIFFDNVSIGTFRNYYFSTVEIATRSGGGETDLIYLFAKTSGADNGLNQYRKYVFSQTVSILIF